MSSAQAGEGGVVALVGEQKLTETLNRYARAQSAAEARQADVLARQGWFAPLLAVAEAFTYLAHDHRFPQEAEVLRHAFVQGLNTLHADKLAYSDDVRRSGDALAEKRTRVDAAHWQLLGRFRFEPDAAASRIARAGSQWLMLCAWCVLLAGTGFWQRRPQRLRGSR